jgi:hypothetical protein
MRSFIAGDGSDSSAAAYAYSATHRQFQDVDLYVINTAPWYAGQYLGKQFRLTSHPAPLVWSYRGTFVPATISRGEVQSKIGLEVDSLDVTWSPQLSDLLASPDTSEEHDGIIGDGTSTAVLTALQGFFAGVFDNGILEVWRCRMLPGGDCNTLGACLLFSGRIGSLELDRLSPKITVMSRLETLNVQVPTNLVEPGNILTQYSVGVLPPNGPASFTVLSGSTASVIYATPVSAPSGYTPANDLYDTGYVVIASGCALGGSYRRIRQQLIEGGNHAFYLQTPLPFAPTPGDTFVPYVPVAMGYSLEPNNEPFPAVQEVPDGTNWSFGLNGSTLTGIPTTDSAGGERVFSFLYHDGTSDVYQRSGGGAAGSWNDNWPVVTSSGAVTWPGASNNQQPPQNEPGIGSTSGFLGFPYVPIPINSSVVI